MENFNFDRAWDINPYNGTAFGALVVLLFVGLFILYRMVNSQMDIGKEKDKALQDKENEIREILNRFHDHADIMREKLIELKISIDGGRQVDESVKKNIDDLTRMIERLTDKFDTVNENLKNFKRGN